MINIVSSDGQHQYDEIGRPITTWHPKACAWIVDDRYKNVDINYNDFPVGCTMEENPDWEKIPDITVSWTWNTAADMQAALGRIPDIHEVEWYKRTQFPFTETRRWGYISDTPKDKCVESFGKYCGWHTGAARVVVTYNGETLFDGKLI